MEGGCLTCTCDTLMVNRITLGDDKVLCLHDGSGRQEYLHIG
jgi:hypothetical protein